MQHFNFKNCFCESQTAVKPQTNSWSWTSWNFHRLGSRPVLGSACLFKSKSTRFVLSAPRCFNQKPTSVLVELSLVFHTPPSTWQVWSSKTFVLKLSFVFSCLHFNESVCWSRVCQIECPLKSKVVYFSFSRTDDQEIIFWCLGFVIVPGASLDLKLNLNVWIESDSCGVGLQICSEISIVLEKKEKKKSHV